MLFKAEEFENAALRLRVDRKYFGNEDFRKRLSHNNHVISLLKFSSNTNPKIMTSDCCVSTFLRRSADGKHLMCFQKERVKKRNTPNTSFIVRFFKYVLGKTLFLHLHPRCF